MEPQIKPSIRKQFLEKFYQRNLSVKAKTEEILEESKTEPQAITETSSIFNNTFINQTSEKPKIPNLKPRNPSPKRGRSEMPIKRSTTPAVTQPKRYSSPINPKKNSKLFIEFLTELYTSKSFISPNTLNKIQPISKILSENFTNDPEFSLEFYIAMNNIINTLNNPESLDFDSLHFKVEEALSYTNENIQELEQQNTLKKQIVRLNLKVISMLKKVLDRQSYGTAKNKEAEFQGPDSEPVLNLFHSYTCFFNEVDKELEILPPRKVQPSKIFTIMHKYLQMPGKMMQTCRKTLEYIHNSQISKANAKYTQELLNKIDKEDVENCDRTGGVLIFFDFLKECVKYYWEINPESESMREIPLMVSKTQKKFSEFEEAVELSKELLQKSSKVLSPSFKKFKLNYDMKNTGGSNKPKIEINQEIISLDSKALYGNDDLGSAVRKIDFDEYLPLVSGNSEQPPPKSYTSRDIYDQGLEEKFKEFLKTLDLVEIRNSTIRVQLFDKFERMIRDEVRTKLLKLAFDTFTE
ncbi:hypothetical protein SteCoe_36789 [Stentor coeruleus]|uniref:Uncharacterized protein n=1 Tax=Stentor coeruleus TaxID=5963 RepID=A0A1R2APG7_9CILI|nr:hypothetical protein SteCoe_36789 [Stentor coeruleus]